ncbi:MAG: HAD-IIB family hydrolase [Spirochaetes bacterium]|nr:HAD-IIB family hydrolase [Spirochaetota bacterium]
MKALFFSDIDGTFLDFDNYCYRESIKGVELLKERAIPLIFISSKTFDEMEILTNELYLHYPFSFENGTGFAYPSGERGEYNIELEGPGVDELWKFLPMLENFLMNKLRAITSLSEDEIIDITKLDVKSAYRAKSRMTTLPFIVDGGRLLFDTEIDRINIFLKDYNLAVIKGGRFNHLIPSNCKKGNAVKKIIEFYKCEYKDEILTASAGDSQSDIPMFESTDFSYIIRRPDGSCINYMNGNIMKSPGPAGFSEAVYDFLNTKVDLWRH